MNHRELAPTGNGAAHHRPQLRKHCPGVPGSLMDRGLTRAPTSPKVLRDYAFIADGLRGALIDSEGSMSWLCFPRWPDPALFAQLLGGGGTYQLRPEGRAVAGGFYEDRSLIWHSRWVTETGSVDCREALAYPGRESEAVILRRVMARDGPQRILVRLELRADYGRQSPGSWRRSAGGAFVLKGKDLSARWSGAPDSRSRRAPSGLPGLEVALDLEAGQSVDLVLELSSEDLRPEPIDPAESWARTEQAWRSAVPDCTGLVAAADVRRSLAVLHGLTGPEGATVAAATTSLPERAEGGRNYDYRYCWIRDICYVGQAGAAVPGGEALLDGPVRWVTERLLEHGERTTPAYLPDGQPIPDQRDLDLPGYPGGHDVVGNRVREQFQLDLFGEALLLLSRAAESDRLGADGWKAVETAVNAIGKRWEEPEAGVWEVHPAQWIHSRLIAVAGLRAAARAGAGYGYVRDALPLADRLLSWSDRAGLHASGRWKRAPDDDRVDASLLLAQVRGGLAADDPRSVATRSAVATDLSREGFVYRYRHPGQALGDAEGAFLVCNFWMSLACLGAGEVPESVRWFERARGVYGPSGLLAEEYDVDQHQLRGNLPQAFVHALLCETAARQTEVGGVDSF